MPKIHVHIHRGEEEQIESIETSPKKEKQVEQEAENQEQLAEYDKRFIWDDPSQIEILRP